MDAAFSLDLVSDLPALFARRQAAAEAALAGFVVDRGLRYGHGEAHRLNLFPAGKGAPVLIFVHGGFWRSLDADLFSFLAPGFVPQGVALAVIDYPLMPEARMADIVRACEMAVEWLAAESGALGVDGGRIFLSGNSAGGQLTAELMARPVARHLLGGTAISGIFDLEPVTRSFQNDALALTAEEVQAFSPIRRGARPRGPMIVTVGERETFEFHRQATAYAGLCQTAPLVVPDADHIAILLDSLAVAGNPLNTAVLAQIAQAC